MPHWKCRSVSWREKNTQKESLKWSPLIYLCKTVPKAVSMLI